MTEDEMYEQIDKELHGGNLVRGLWTRLYAEVDGDEAKAKSRYIKARAEQLRGSPSIDKSGDGDINPDVLAVVEVILENVAMTLLEKPFLLTKEQQSELQIYGEEARKAFDKKDPTVGAMLAGMSLSKGGAEKIFGLLGTYFSDLASATSEIPPKCTANMSHKVFINIEARAQLYLFTDMCRHRLRAGWAMSAKKREEVEEYNRKFDKQAWLAVLYIKLSHVLLETFSLR